MKKRYITAVLSSLVLVSGASGAIINWGSVSESADVNDVDVTGGAVVYAMNGGAANVTVSGIAFAATSYTNLPSGVTVVDNMGLKIPGDRTVVNRITGTTGDANYDTLLDQLTDSRTDITNATMTFAGLNAGTDYQIQVWYQDDSRDGRIMVYGDGLGNDVNVTADPDFGQNVIGTFTADSSTQGLTMVANGFSNVHYNAILVQAVPEPATLGLFAVFGGGLLYIRRRRFKM